MLKEYWERQFTAARRQSLAKSGAALPDGSYPIVTRGDLENAIRAIGRASNPGAAKAHIIKRAKALGAADMLPAEWSASTKKEAATMPCPTCDGTGKIAPGNTMCPTCDGYGKVLQNLAEAHDVYELKEGLFEAVEATEDGKMRARMTIIKAGRSKNPRNYRESALRNSVTQKLWDGVRMFVNHSQTPPLKRPPTDMVSAIESAEWDDKGKQVVGNVVFFNKEFYEFAKRAKDYMGSSVNILGKGDRVRQSDGSYLEDVQELVKVHSDDWVVYPAAGGEIQQFLESEGDEEVDWSKITADDLRANAPELVKALQESGPDDDPDEGGDGADKKKVEAPATLTAAEAEALFEKKLQEAETRREQAAAKRAAAQTKIADQITKSGLPEKTRERLTKQFFSATEYVESEVVSEITSAREELKAAGVGPKIVGEGPSAGSGEAPKDGELPKLDPKRFAAMESIEAGFGIVRGVPATKQEGAAK